MTKVVLITGASRGIGRATARLLGARGWSVGVNYAHNEAAAQQTAAEVGRAGGHARVIPGDVSQEADVIAMFDALTHAFGRIDALVNNAAQACFAPLAQTTDEVLEEMTAINLMAPLRLVRAAEPALRSSRGVVVNVGSIGGVLALPGRAAYGATKAALHHLTRSLARELAPDIRVNAVLPGAIDTEMYDHTGLSAADTAALRAEMIRTTPMGRLGTPADVVPWIELLLGSAGRWVTGSLLVVDGGRAC
jgi:NAD(P)-dependent dehydrogenase (short-subunit alcohol dehydrogenase family)